MSNYDLSDLNPPKPDFLKEILSGLTASPKYICPKYFYDAEGSRLFDAITELPEYYIARSELEILTTHKESIASAIGQNTLLIEYGSGSSRKIRTLLEAIRPSIYMPIDISKEHLEQSAKIIAKDYPWLAIKAVCADYTTAFELPSLPESNTKRVVFFPGSTLGNHDPSEALGFLERIHKMVGQGGGLLVGIDRQKPAHLFRAAYNDAQGVTAAFNLNALSHINCITGANFSLNQFKHEAIYNDDEDRVEMRLHSLQDQSIELQGQAVHFRKDERINTEHSNKYKTETFLEMVTGAGFECAQHWTDSKGYFSVFYLTT